MHPTISRPAAVLAFCLLPLACAAEAADSADSASSANSANSAEPPNGDVLRYALGLALVDSPTYAGAAGRVQKLRPLWSLRYGRFRLSGARSSGLLGATAADKASGASVDLIDSPRWMLGLGLRIDNGRSAGDDPALAGLPEIRSTLRGKLHGGLDLGAGFGTSLSYSADLLGRGGGGQLGWGLGYTWAPWPEAMASVGVGASWADKQHMQTYFGIAPDVALRTGRAAFQPGPGLKDLNAGMSLRMPLGGRWTLISGVGLSQLQGDAAASPLTRKTFGATALVAAAWTSR
jgi:outer membrane scaffolding protein for murein synthesis (MipA/OmpV family)